VGGEEFAIVLTEVDHATALAFAEELRIATEKLGIPHQGNTVAPVVTLSLGLLSVAANAFDYPNAIPLNWENVYHRADDLLYQAKHAGRNCVAVGDWQPQASESST